MATNEHSASQRVINNSLNHNMVDTLLYPESKITRQQAIREIADVILRANIKPRTVECTLQLLQKLLPSDHTLPSTTEELFGAMISSENDWRLAQYLIRHKQSPSFFSSSNMSNAHSNMSTTINSSLSLHQPESNILAPASSLFLPFNDNESSSSSDDENELTAYERLQQCLRPFTEVAESFNPNYSESLPFMLNNNCTNIPLSDQRSQLAFNSFNPSTFLESFKRLISETSSVTSTNEQDLFHTTRIFDENDDTDDEITDDNSKLCCFEMNGYDLLNDGKRRRYI